MSDGGATATASVIRGGNRDIEICIPLVCVYPDGQFKYEVTATARLTIPAGDPLPAFVPKGLPYCLEASRVPPVSGGAPECCELPPWMRLAPASPFAIHGHTVCRSADGQIKWEADTDPIKLDLNRPLPDPLLAVNTVVDARPLPSADSPSGSVSTRETSEE